MNHILSLIICLFLLFSFAACTTSSGSLFRDTWESDKGKDSGSTNTTNDDDDDDNFFFPADDDYEEEEGLYITSHPSGASVYLNYAYHGTTPLWVPDLATGNYTIELKLAGYAVHNKWLYYPGGYLEYHATLYQITGHLDLSVSPPDATVYLDEDEISAGVTELGIGSYNLRVRKFGYTDVYKHVTIREDMTTELDLTLEEAPFSLSDLSVTRKEFNPRNAGNLGTIGISFHVSNYGTGKVRITDTAGIDVYSESLPRFQTWYQYIPWSGRTDDGTMYPDGSYTITIEAVSGDTGEVHVLTTTVWIDSSITIAFRSMWNGIAGLLYSGTPDVLPASSFQISTAFAMHFEEYNNQLLTRSPVQLGLRFGTGNNIESNILATVILTDTDDLPFTVSAAVKYQFLRTNGTFRLQSALYGKAAYHSGTGADTLSNYTGLSSGIPFQMSAGPLSLILNPEVIVSMYQVTYTPDYDERPGFAVWGYGRMGLLYESGSFTTGISCAIRTTPFNTPGSFGIHYPLLGAYELHVLVPDSGVYISLITATEFESLDNYYVMGGFGMGLIY